ncbi:MAG: LCP family protein [Acidimicrobiia bacterium]
MARFRRFTALCGALAIVVSACSTASTPESTTATSSTSTTLQAAAVASTSTTTPATTTTEQPIDPVSVTGDLDAAIAAVLSNALTALNDPRAESDLPEVMGEHHATDVGTFASTYGAVATIAELADGTQVGVVRLDSDDVVLIADEGDGWQVVGTHMTSLDAAPFYGESPRRVLVLGSDARPGQNPPVFRMDSIHVLTAVPSENTGAILGYPRDSWVDTEYGSMRVNALTSSGRGPDALYSFFTNEWETPVEGYILTGFSGFERLVDATLGRLEIRIPIPIPTQEWFDGFSAGEQRLSGLRTLDFARTRKLIPGGDFTRSFHQGIVMLAVLTMLQRGEVETVPMLLAELSKYTETNLSASDLIQLGAAAMDMDIGTITNEVLPGSLGRTSGGASVVFLDGGWQTIVQDVVDDGIRNESSG